MTALSFVFFGGCQKESALLNQDSLQGKNESKIDPKYKAPSVEDAQNWFEQSFGKTHTIITKVGDSTQSLVLNVRGSSPQIDVTPIWSNAQISSYLSNRQVLMMPVNTISALQKRGVGYCAVFFKDSVGKIGYTLQVTATKPNYLASHEHLSVNDFSGVFLQIIPNGQIKNTLVVDEGKIIGAFKVSSANQFNLSGNPPCNCGTWDDMWNAILVDLWGSGGFTTHDPFSGIIYGDASLYDPPGGSAGIPVYYPPIILNSEIDNTLFDVSGQTVKFSFYQDIYMRQLSLTDTEFEVLYFDKKLFTLVDGFLNNNTFSVSSVKIIKYLINNHAFANSNKITNIFTILNSNEPL